MIGMQYIHLDGLATGLGAVENISSGACWCAAWSRAENVVERRCPKRASNSTIMGMSEEEA